MNIKESFILIYYYISLSLSPPDETMPSETTTQSKENLCQCPKLDAESIIPTPHVDDYHNKEQWLYKDALSNFL